MELHVNRDQFINLTKRPEAQHFTLGETIPLLYRGLVIVIGSENHIFEHNIGCIGAGRGPYTNKTILLVVGIAEAGTVAHGNIRS